MQAFEGGIFWMAHLLTIKYGGITLKECIPGYSSQEIFTRDFYPGIDGQIVIEGRAC